MKKISFSFCFIVLTVVLVTGQTNFRKTLALYEDSGLAHKALQVVDSVLNSHPDAVDYLYAVDYRLKLLPQVFETDPNGLLDTLHKHQNVAPIKARPLLKFMEAQLLINYYETHQWNIDQKEDDGTVNSRLEEWSRHDFRTVVQQCLKEAIDEAMRQRLSFKEFQEFCSVDDYYARFFPTLADQLLFHAATLFPLFEQGKWDVAEVVLGSVESIEAPSMVSQQVLQWFLQWWNLNEGAELIRGYIALSRLNWLHSVNTSYERMEHYEQQLWALHHKFRNSDCDADILMTLANHYYSLSSNYSPFEPSTAKYYPTLQKAKDIALQIVNEYHGSVVAQTAKELLSTIEKPYVAVSMEKEQTAGQNIPVGIVYCNTKRVEILIKKVPTEVVFRQYDYTPYVSLPSDFKTMVELPQSDDYYRHTTRTVIPSLTAGGYILQVKADGVETVILGFMVSGLNSIIEQQYPDQVNLWLIDRWTGEPVKKGVCEVLVSRYNRRAATDRFEVIDRLTITNGMATVEMKKLSSAMALRFISSGDTLWQYNSSAFSTGFTQTVDRVQMFSDRAIYRPGQTLELKGIWYRGDGERWKVVPAQKLTLTVRDDNYQEIRSYDVITNDFGSFGLSIPIPADIKPGYLSINSPLGGHSVRVEYYRRYTFDGTFEAKKRVVFPGDSVELLFSAKSFSGVGLKQFKIVGDVKFSTRKAWWLPVSEKTVAVLDTVIGGDGYFKIQFPTPKNIDYQHYNLNLTVTTASGESRTFTHSFIVSNEPLELSIDKSYWLMGEPFPEIKLRTVNGEGLNQPVTLSIERLSQPDNVFIPLLLPRADKFLLSYTEWKRQLPFIPYDKEHEPETWAVEREVVRQTMKADAMVLPDDVLKQLTEGVYRITVSVLGKRLVKQITVLNPDDRKLSVTELFEVYTSRNTVKPGEMLRITMVSSVDNLPVWYGITAGNQTLEQKRIVLKKGKHTITIPVTQKHEGQIFINAVAGKYGTLKLKNLMVAVEPLSRKIDVEVISMRKQIEPGTQQQWTFRLRTPDNRPMEAEVLASMYDRSLDVFLPKPMPQFQVWYRQNNTTGFSVKANTILSNSTSKPYFYYSQPHPIQWTFRGLSGWFDDYLRSPKTKFRSGQEYLKGAVMQTALPEGVESGDKAEVNLQEAETDNPAVVSTSPSQGISQRLRSNFNETAFFYPQLLPDEKGEFVVKFEAPDALTGWNFEIFAHDKQLGSGYFRTEITTRLPFMVKPLFPRLAYTGDSLTLLVMVMNQTDSMITVVPGGEVVDIQGVRLPVKTFPGTIQLAPGTENAFSLALSIPKTPGVLSFKVFAHVENFTDGEETLIPVYPNKQLVTNTIALWGKPAVDTEFSFQKLLPETDREEKSLSVTLELSTNPTWYALQSLPFFDNPDSKSAFSLIASLFAVQTGNLLLEKFPEIKTVFQAWTTIEAETLVSKLEANKNLKIADLEKTPWFNQGLDETERMKKVASFLDKNKVNYLTRFTLENLQKLQTPSGGFSWIPEWHPSFYVTLYVSEYLGRLFTMNPSLEQSMPELRQMNSRAIAYLTVEVEKMFSDLLQSKSDTAQYIAPYSVLRFLYAKSLNDKDYRPTSDAEKYFYRHSRGRWQSYNLYGRALLGILARRSGDIKTAETIIKAFDGSSVISSEKGMFWRENIRGWEWYQAPIATQVQIMEFYQTMQASTDRIDAMKIWLLHHKQTHMWNDAEATVQAVYALTTTGRNWLRNNSPVTIILDNLTISSNEIQKQSGTGHFITTIDWRKINPLKGKGVIRNPNSNPVYGGLYAQYFETFENIPSWQKELSLETQYFVISAMGDELRLRSLESANLKTGDKVRVRMTITSQRELEFVIVRLPYAACFEPAQMMSGFGQKGGEWYYVENYDDRSDFYFYRLKQGVTVLEFDMYVLRPGRYSAAPATVQSLYAPEFLGRSKGCLFTPEP